MKTVKLFILFLVSVCLASCGGSDLKPTSNKIQGPLGKFFEVVERNYSLKDGQVSIEFKRIAEGGPKSVSWSSSPTFTVELLDADGNVVASDETDVVYDSSPLESVFSLGMDETKTIAFKFEETKGAVSFKVSSKWDESKEKSSDESSQTDDSSSAETNSSATGMQPSDIILPSQLKGVVEVLNGESGSITVNEGIGGIPNIELTFKLLKKTSTSSMENPYGQVFIYGVPQDKNGRAISEIMPSYGEWRPNDSDGDKFKEFLKGDVDGTITLTFSGTSSKFDKKCDNENGCKKIAKFKLSFNRSN
jgi:hypothetical protein